MRKIVEFELLSPLMCGGVRVADNFLESEKFIRGSVLRAAFANDILLECPLADMPSEDGKLNYIELKQPEGKCANCVHREKCRKFSDMYFSFAYPQKSIPAPMTLRACKSSGLKHPLQDIIYQKSRLSCSECQSGTKRMEGFKGYLRMEDNVYVETKVNFLLSTHTAIDYHTHTAEDGKLFSIKAVPAGWHFTAEIDDCDSGMLFEGKEIYVGKYSSVGYGKLKIVSITDSIEITEQLISKKVEKFQKNLDAPYKAALLFLSDAIFDIPITKTSQSTKDYLELWHNVIIGDANSPVRVEKVYAETQLYSGYDTSESWGNWKVKEPKLYILKGTSVLLDISNERIEEAMSLLTDIAKNGVGCRTSDGFGAVAVCHDLHQLGVCSHE